MLAIPAFILAVCALCHCVALQTVRQRQRLEKQKHSVMSLQSYISYYYESYAVVFSFLNTFTKISLSKKKNIKKRNINYIYIYIKL